MGQYDAFISYSHAVDGDLAVAVRNGLQQLARPWNKRRALNVFLDKAALEVSAGLRASLQQDLAGTEWLIVLLSEGSAGSEWVGQEIAHWAATKSADRILLVHTDGELHWADGDWDYARSTAAPKALSGLYAEEPLWLDLRRHRGEPDLDIRANAAFKDDLATLAAPIHGTSKEDLVGEDLAQYRRARRVRRIAVSLLAVLTVTATIAGIVAFLQRQDALSQARRAQSRAIAAQALVQIPGAPDLAALLALESLRVADTREARSALLAAVGTPTRFAGRDREHAAALSASAYHPSGAHAATGDEDGGVVIRSFDAGLGGAPHVVGRAQLDAGVAGLAFVTHAGAPAVQAVGEDGTVARWTLAGEEVLRNSAAARAVAAAPGRDHVAAVVGGELQISRLDDPGRAPIARTPLGSPAMHASFGAADRYVAWSEGTAVTGSAVMVWDWKSGATPRAVAHAPVTSLALHPDRPILAIGALDGIVTLVDLAGAAPDATLQFSDAPITAVAFAAGGDSLAAGDNEGAAAVFDLEGPGATAAHVMSAHRDAVRTVAVAADGRIVSGSGDGEAVWWRQEADAPFGRAHPPGAALAAPLLSAAFIGDELVAVTDGEGAVLRVPLSGGAVEVVEPGGAPVLDAAGGTLLMGTGGALFVMPDAGEAGAVARRLEPGPAGTVWDVDLAPDGALAAAAVGGTVALWDLASGELFGRPALPDGFEAFSVLFGSDRLWVGGALAGDGPAALEVDLERLEVTGEPLRPGGDPAKVIRALAESPDGALLATGGIDRKIAVWDTRTHLPAGEPFIGSRGAVNGLAFVDGGDRLVSIDDDRAVAYWDVADRRLVGSFAGPSQGGIDLSISPDGSRLAVVGYEGRVWTWPLDTRQWIDMACALAGRNLDELEWRLYGRGEPVRHCGDLPGAGPAAEYPLPDGG